MHRPIDADALLAKLEDWRGDKEDVDVDDAHDVAYYSAMSRAIRFAKDAPTLDYEPVMHGEWEWDTLDVYMCSAFGEKSHVKEVLGKPDWRYCPNCGALMDAKEDAHG